MEVMSTVKERAAALNLAGKLYSPMHHPPGCTILPDQPTLITPCQTSFIWSRLISHLQSEVKVKRRRHFLKSHDNCFVGSDAVTVIQDYINQSKILGDAKVPRAKAVRVCQALLDCKVFEAVSCKTFGKESKRSEFQDSVNSLYRFLNTQTPGWSSAENSLSSPSNEGNTDTQLYRDDDPMFSHSTPVKPGHIMNILLEELDLSLSFLHADGLPASVVSKVWQEQTVQRLLQLIELPLLDGVLQCGECPLSAANNNEPDILYTSHYLDREILKAFKESQKDEWLVAALELMDFLPDQQVVEVSRELPSLSLDDEDEGSEEHGQWSPTGIQQCKALLFEILAKHYGQTSFQPLLPSGLNDVYAHITELLVNGKFDVALEVLQLCLKLLSAANRDELYRLLSFMSLAADPQHIRLHKELENRIHVKKTFCKAIIQSKSLSKGKVDLLLLFMLDNHEDIFKVPGSLHKLVSDKLDDVVKKKDPNKQGSAFCQQISSNVYSDTIKNQTNTELFVLLRNIDENPKYSMKEKRRLLEQFYTSHPEIFMQYFGSRLSTINLSEV